MTQFRTVTPDFGVAPQIATSDLAEAAAQGYTRIVNNRPDGEAPGQPTGAEMEAAARATGLDYRWIPVVGGPTPTQADAMAQAVAGAGKTLAFCRSGTRSINTWGFGQIRAGAMTADDVVALGAAAGYDLSWLGGVGR